MYPGSTTAAVDDVSLEVDPGKLVVLLGPSGCGKTTLLKMVNRLYEPTDGDILLDGQKVGSFEAPGLRRRIGYVIQQTGLFPHMRIEDNVAVVPRLLGWDKKAISQRVDELLDLVGLPPQEFRRRYPGQLSGGQQQRVGLARALAARPTTLLMDEPFGALDAITRTRLQDELRSIHRQFGQTILFVTHDVEEAVRLADLIVVMRAGKVVQYDEPLRIMVHPADDFVSDLVGAGDVLRKLSLLPATAALQPGDGHIGDGPRVNASTDLRSALSLLLESEAERLRVVDDDDSEMGWIDLAAIHTVSMRAHEHSPDTKVAS